DARIWHCFRARRSGRANGRHCARGGAEGLPLHCGPDSHATTRQPDVERRAARARHSRTGWVGFARRDAVDRPTRDQEALVVAHTSAPREIATTHLVHRGARCALELGTRSCGSPRARRQVEGRGPEERSRPFRSRMSDRTSLAVRFLTSMAQALATMSLYAEGHPVRARAAVASFDTLRDLQDADPRPSFSFLGSDVVYGQQAIRTLTDWEWATRLANVGVQRLEF